MAAAGGISIGDAVLTFLADTTQLDSAVARINSQTAGKLQPAGEAVKNIAQNFETTGAAAASAGEKTKAAGEQMAEGLREASKEAKEGTATVGLLSEATGVTLPRHVRSFLASLPGIGAALSAAFAATAVLFLIDTVIQATEKFEEFSEKPRKIEEAWRDVGDATVTANRQLTDALDASEAKIIGLTKGPLAEMDFQIQHIGSDAEKVAGLVGNMGAAVVKALGEQDTSKFNLFSFFLDNSRDVTKQATKFFQDLQSTIVQVGNSAGLVSVKAEIQGLDAQIQKSTEDLKKESAEAGTLFDILAGRKAEAAIEVTKQLLDSQEKYRGSLVQTQAVIQKGADLDDSNKRAAELEKVRAAGELNAAQAKRDLDSQIAGIQQRQAIQHAAFVSGETDVATFKVAQLNAIDATTAAQEQYLAKLVTIYSKSGDVVKSQAIAQQLATAQTKDATDRLEALTAATEKYHAETLKIVKDWQDIQNNAIAKSFEAAQQAAERLTQAEIRLAEAQKNLSGAQTKTDFSAQENAIAQLANFGIITENQKAERLRILYQQEENDALNSLKDLLAKEKSAVDAAQTKLDVGRNNPFLTDAQVADLQVNLDRLKTLYTNTQTEIVNTTAGFEQKRIALQRGAVAQAIALARSEGNATVAASLQEKQVQLDNIDNEIRLARARGQNTQAMERERAAILATTRSLIQEVHGTSQLQKAIVELKQTMTSFAQEEVAAFATATEAAISSQESFGKALESATLRVISHLAQQWADYYIALAIAEAASGDWGAAAGHTAAAIAFEAVAGAASAVANNIDAGAQKSSAATGSTSSSATTEPTNPAQTAGQQPVTVINTPRLAGGGLFTKRTLAVIGDSAGGGDQREAVLPLGQDSSALDEIAGRLHERMGGGSGGGDTYIYQIKGSVIDHAKLMKEQTRQMKKGKGRMTVNNSFRVTRRG